MHGPTRALALLGGVAVVAALVVLAVREDAPHTLGDAPVVDAPAVERASDAAELPALGERGASRPDAVTTATHRGVADPVSARGASLGLAPPDVDDLPAGTVAFTLRVVDRASGAPLAGAVLELPATPWDVMSLADEGDREAHRAADDGTLRVVAAERIALVVVVRHPGHGTLRWRWGVPGAEDVPPTIDLPLVPVAAVEGRVVDDTGAPVAGAPVGAVTGPLRLPREVAEAWALPGRADDLDDGTHTATDAQGLYRITLPPPCIVDVVAAPAGHVEARASVDIAGPGTTAGVDITCVRLGGVRGRVLMDGAPFAGCSVRALVGDREMAGHASPLGDDGRYAFLALPPGPLRLEVGAWQRPYPIHEVPVEILPGTVLETDLAFADPRLPPIRGRVVWPDGEPVHAATVQMLSRQAHTPWDVRTDAEGRFEFEAWHDEPVIVHASFEGAQAFTHAGPGDEHLVLELPELGRIVFELVDARSGGPLDSPRMRHFGYDRIAVSTRGESDDDFGDVDHRRLDEECRAELWRPAGRYDVRIGGEAMGYGAMLLSGVDVPPRSAEPASVRVALDPGERVGWSFHRWEARPFSLAPPESAVFVVPEADVTVAVSSAPDVDALAAALRVTPAQLESSRLSLSRAGEGWLALPRGRYRLVFVPPITSSSPETFAVPRDDGRSQFVAYEVNWEP